MTDQTKPWSPHDLGTGMLLEHPLVFKQHVGKQVHILRRLKHGGQEWQPGTMPWFEVRIAGEELNGNCYPAFPADAIGEYVEPEPPRTAYLVAHLDITKAPPAVNHVGIYSENAGSLTNNWRTTRLADLMQVRAPSFSEACDQLREFIATDALMAWLKPLMPREFPECGDPKAEASC